MKCFRAYPDHGFCAGIIREEFSQEIAEGSLDEGTGADIVFADGEEDLIERVNKVLNKWGSRLELKYEKGDYYGI